MCKYQKFEDSNHHFPELNRRKKFWQSAKEFFSPKKITVLTILLTIIMGFIYLTQTNITATKGYKIKELEENLNKLKEENKKLNLQYTKAQSMANIISQAANLNLVATKEMEIITPLGSAVALK